SARAFDGAWQLWQLATPGSLTSLALVLVSTLLWHDAQSACSTCGLWLNTDRSNTFGSAATGAILAPSSTWHLRHGASMLLSVAVALRRSAGVSAVPGRPPACSAASCVFNRASVVCSCAASRPDAADAAALSPCFASSIST